MRALYILSSCSSVAFLALAALDGLGAVCLPFEFFMGLTYLAGALAFAGALAQIKSRREAK